MHRRPHLRAAWLVLLVFALALLAPTVSRAMAHAKGQSAPWSLVCSATGGPGQGAPAGAPKHAGVHCPACHLQASDLAPPPAAAFGPAWHQAGPSTPERPTADPRAAVPWQPGHPRAPPSLG